MGSSSNNNSGGGGGGGGVPPGFRFHPTDEELLHYYLKKKVSFHKFEMEVIRDVDLNKLEPWDLQERCRIGSTPQNEWYFFSHKDRKYPTGSRTNRATNAGFWKATGRDKCIRNTFQKIGMRKTLVFYRGRAPHGHKTDWIMHEYRLDDSDHPDSNDDHHLSLQEDGWVVCRVFKKKNLFKVGGTGNEGGGSGGVGSSSTATTSTNINNINMNSSSSSNLHHHHHHHQLLLDSTTTTSSGGIGMQPANMQYYNLLRPPQNDHNPMHPHHHHHHQYLMATTTQHHQALFELNNKPDTDINITSTTPDHHHVDHDLALHTYHLPPQHYYGGGGGSATGSDAVALRYGQPPPATPPPPAGGHQDQWTTNDDDGGGGGGDDGVVLLPGSLSHNSNGSVGMIISNRLSLGATSGPTTTAEMDFWGGYAK